MKKKLRAFSILEVLISAGIFTIVILGISQTVLLMHRYARGNLCQMQAHLLATSYFEQLLCHTHPLELNGKDPSIDLLDLNDPTTKHTFDFNVKTSTNTAQTYPKINTFKLNLNDMADTMTVYVQVQVEESPIYTDYDQKKREEINPPEGFQSLRMKYWWTSPFATTNGETEGSVEYLNTLPNSELYAIRPILPDEADLES